MKLKSNQEGFMHVVTLVLTVMIIVIGIVSWRVWNQSSITKTTNDSSYSPASEKEPENEEKDATNIVTLTLISKATGKAVSKANVHIYSDNGIRCIQGPCPTNGKSWDGTTNDNGEISVSKDYIQSNTNVTLEGFSGKYIDYKDGQTAYRLEF